MGQCGIPHSRAVKAWFDAHTRMLSLFIAPYSPFFNPIEEFFSAWRWKVVDRHPQDQMSLLDAMDAASQDITAEHCQGWIRHTKISSQYALPEKISGVLWMWPNAETGPDQTGILFFLFFSGFSVCILT